MAPRKIIPFTSSINRKMPAGPASQTSLGSSRRPDQFQHRDPSAITLPQAKLPVPIVARILPKNEGSIHVVQSASLQDVMEGCQLFHDGFDALGESLNLPKSDRNRSVTNICRKIHEALYKLRVTPQAIMMLFDDMKEVDSEIFVKSLSPLYTYLIKCSAYDLAANVVVGSRELQSHFFDAPKIKLISMNQKTMKCVLRGFEIEFNRTPVDENKKTIYGAMVSFLLTLDSFYVECDEKNKLEQLAARLS